MNLKKYALMAEIIGAGGVIVSLLFVGVQIKGNSDLLAAQTVLDLRDSNSIMSRDMITNSEFAEIVYQGTNIGFEALDDMQKWRFEFWVEEVLTHRMTAWKYAEQGLLDPEEVETWQRSTCAYLENPGPRAVWEQDRPWIRDDFREYVEQTCSSM